LNIIKKFVHQGYERPKVVEYHQKNSQARKDLHLLRYYKKRKQVGYPHRSLSEHEKDCHTPSKTWLS
jgi:hypothetical protein